jgi:serine/threonine protein kinase
MGNDLCTGTELP